MAVILEKIRSKAEIFEDLWRNLDVVWITMAATIKLTRFVITQLKNISRITLGIANIIVQYVIKVVIIINYLSFKFLILKRLNKSCIYLHLLRCIYRSATNNLSDLITISFFNIAHLKKLKVKRATVVSFYVNVIKMSLNAGVNILNHR